MSIKIMFVCTGNTCRSPMAEVIAKDVFGEMPISIISRGVSVYETSMASKNAIDVMQSIGIDLSNHISTQVTISDMLGSDLIFTMTAEHKKALQALSPQSSDKIFTITEYSGATKDILDPYGLDLHYYNLCALELQKYILLIKEKIKD